MTSDKADFDPILLSLFSNRFMSVAEAMGRALQQTSISTNIKERLDYSCALFSANGDLVANAPFIPVHLGSMSFAIKYQLDLLGPSLKPGDVLLANSPVAGGSHLPDLTVITPVFASSSSSNNSSNSTSSSGNQNEGPVPDAGKQEIIFFTASRGHHADIGGAQPGSMPSYSTSLSQEGAEIVSFKLVSEGKFDREGLRRRMVDVPGEVEGCSGCRDFRSVESDIKAQIAANFKGIQLLHALIAEYDLETVHAYMKHIRDNAEQAVRKMLIAAAKVAGTDTLSAIDYMDDGSPIALKVTIDKGTGDATFDFTGTGPEVRGNWNAPISVVHSAIIYCMRAMVDQDIPLNAGCLVPLNIIIPENSLLSPSPEAAVCAGNVLTSQRITDVCLKAFQACAASQGCCNNLSFGTGGKDKETGEVSRGWGYYETIAGGSGAGPNWHGTSGVHVHMTNTRITDPEILERRYPVILHQFGYRSNSGGKGLYNGGDGVIREMEFLQPIEVSLLTERRARQPYGMAGGEDGQSGLNLQISTIKRKTTDGKEELVKRERNLGGKATVAFSAGDRLVLNTPGGGGWGVPGGPAEVKSKVESFAWEPRGSLAERSALEAAFGA
ncbi:hypothetical protein FFLO_01857 [Filobasidium floriforme]|uniref:Hydantoinase B/oxoprolinase domain-containing protein n=1 Tax=Filobasidium floriforme TaxID=5210 RepID=A0A8K0NUI2_9TREE|nr:hypothetical protein FFLO_01857 [Filobasidium floriforme]